MSNELTIITTPEAKLPVFTIAPLAIETRDEALAVSALIGKVENADQNQAAVRAHIALKSVAAMAEAARKKMKEPVLETGRQLDRTVAEFLADVEKEMGRLQNLTRTFQIAEQRRVREEEEVQRRELERIERERQAELRRIAAEEEATRLKAEATQRHAENLKRLSEPFKSEGADQCVKLLRQIAEEINAPEGPMYPVGIAFFQRRLKIGYGNAVAIVEELESRGILGKSVNGEPRAILMLPPTKEEVEKAAQEAESSKSIANLVSQVASQQTQLIEDRASEAKAAESRLIQVTRAAGQRIVSDWDINVTNPYELAKFHPDCVKIEPLLTPIKAKLNEGIEVKGVSAKKVTKTDVRARVGATVDV